MFSVISFSFMQQSSKNDIQFFFPQHFYLFSEIRRIVKKYRCGQAVSFPFFREFSILFLATIFPIQLQIAQKKTSAAFQVQINLWNSVIRFLILQELKSITAHAPSSNLYFSAEQFMHRKKKNMVLVTQKKHCHFFAAFFQLFQHFRFNAREIFKQFYSKFIYFKMSISISYFE